MNLDVVAEDPGFKVNLKCRRHQKTNLVLRVWRAVCERLNRNCNPFDFEAEQENLKPCYQGGG